MDQPIETLWNQMHVRLCRFICSRIPDGDDAEDILQDVFIRIHTHLDSVREIDRLEGWIFQIARNSITDRYRARSRFVELDDVVVEDDYQEEDAAESLLPHIRELVHSLPEPYRQALLLTEYEGLSQQEAADRMGISLSGAKSRVQRARQKVRAALMACCHFEFDARGMIYDMHPHCCYCPAESKN